MRMIASGFAGDVFSPYWTGQCLWGTRPQRDILPQASLGHEPPPHVPPPELPAPRPGGLVKNTGSEHLWVFL